MERLFAHPLFWLGFVIKVLLIYLMAPIVVADYFAPFLQNSMEPMTLDPWSSWLAKGGSALAFPYGYAMWLQFLPLIFVAAIFDFSINHSYMLTLLCDAVTLRF